MSKARNNVVKLNNLVSVKDFGAVGDGVADDTAAIQAAINSFAGGQNTNVRSAGSVLLLPQGVYKTTSSLLVDAVNISIVGDDARITHTGANPCFLVGNANYLTNLVAGYYFFGLDNVAIFLTNAAGVGIRNNGYRRLVCKNLYVNGGLIGFESEGAFAMGKIEDSTFQSQSGAGSKGVHLKQRNNLFALQQVAALSGAEIGIHLSTVSAELKGVVLSGCDVEGCGVGYLIDGGNIGSITFLSCWG